MKSLHEEYVFFRARCSRADLSRSAQQAAERAWIHGAAAGITVVAQAMKNKDSALLETLMRDIASMQSELVEEFDSNDGGHH